MSNARLSKSHPSVTQMLEAVNNGDANLVFKLLHAKRVYVNVSNKHGETPLHIAAGYGNLEITKILCMNNATVDIMDRRGDTPLYWAARHGHLEVVKYLCSEGACVNSRDHEGETALHVSSRYDQPEVLSFLCQADAMLDVPDNDGDTPLLCGTWHGYQTVVEVLVKAGSSLNYSNKDGETPLHVAAVRGYLNLVQYFCESGADMNFRDRLGCTPLQLATRRCRLDIVQFFCQQENCNVNIQNMNGDTALHDACREGDPVMFLALLSNTGCKLDLQNNNGATPLHLAAKYGHKDLVRQLCIAGCNVHKVNNSGQTADQAAGSNSQGAMAALIRHLRKSGNIKQYSDNLIPNQVPITRVKLFLCGASGVGKTELVKSLKCHFIRSLFRRRSDSNVPHMIQQRTHGIMVHQLTIPNAGNFSVWDFSGLKSYYCLHEEFLRTTNSIICLVFKVCDPLDKQLAQLRFWLSLIKAKIRQSETVRFAGECDYRPNVVLVGSFSPLPTLAPPTELDGYCPPSTPSRLPNRSSEGVISIGTRSPVLEVVKKEYGRFFVFSDRVYNLDCRLSQTAEIKALRQHLGALRAQVIQTQPKVPHIVEELSQAIPDWRENHDGLPVLTWMAFLEKTRHYINPLVSEDIMVQAVSTIHNMGEVVYIREGPLCNIVVLDPMWLGLRIFGPALSPENSVVPQLKSVTGYINLSTLQHVYPELEPASIVNLFEHFEFCAAVDENRYNFLFPGLIKMEEIHGLWERSSEFAVYAGIQLVCQRECDIFTPSVFPRIQICARKSFSNDIDDQELTLWRGGLKCCRGGVEVLLRYPDPGYSIEIMVRGGEEVRSECYMVLQQFYTIAAEMVYRVNPGTAFNSEVISAKRLREHRPVLSYSPIDIFEAERGDGVLRHPKMPDAEENILDVVCCGCEELLISTQSAPYTPFTAIPLHTRKELSRLLDPPDPLGRDWCLLALKLQFTEEVQQIEKMAIAEHLSPTDCLLQEWSKSVQSNVVAIVDALRAINREDAASTLIKGLSPFSNPDKSVVISVPGMPLASYIC